VLFGVTGFRWSSMTLTSIEPSSRLGYLWDRTASPVYGTGKDWQLCDNSCPFFLFLSHICDRAAKNHNTNKTGNVSKYLA
jgi:hypothetical protein